MNIAIFTNAYLPIRGGVTTSILSHKKYLESHGHKVYIFAPKFHNYEDKDPCVFRYPSIPWKAKEILYPMTFFDSRKIKKKFQHLNIDIIHSQHPFIFGSIAYKYSKKFNIPLVFTYHSQYDKYVHYSPVPRFLSNWVGGLVNKSAQNFAEKADKVIVVGKAMEKYLKNKLKKNNHVTFLPTGINADIFNPKIVKKDNYLKNKLVISDNDKVIIHVGRINKEKNFSFLYESVTNVLKKHKNYKFIVIGPGCLIEEYEEKAKQVGLQEQVKVIGTVEYAKIPKYLKLGDVFVFSSKSETQGLVINEAQAMGLPVVAVKASGVEDAVIDKKTGFLMQENEEKFHKKVLLLLNNNELRKKMGEKAILNAQNFSEEKMGEKLVNLYKEVIYDFNSKSV